MGLKKEKEKKYNSKEVFQYIFCILSLIFSCIMLQVPISFTGSGVLSFYCSEIIGIFAGAFALIYIIKNRKNISKDNKTFTILTFIFFAYCIVDYIIRVLTKGVELKSIVVIESNVFVIGFMLLITLELLDLKIVLKSISIFSAILGISAIIIFYFMYNNINNVLFTSGVIKAYTFGHAHRTFLLTLFFPITAYCYLRLKDKLISVCYYIHFISLIICGVLSSSRVNYLLLPLIIIIVLVTLFIKKSLPVKSTIISFILSIIVVFSTSPFFIQSYAQLKRLPVSSYVISSLHIKYIDSLSNVLNNDKDINTSHNKGKDKAKEIKEAKEKKELNAILKNAESSTGQSTSVRSIAWKKAINDIKVNPLLGVGLRTYKCTSSDKVLTAALLPHNFVLEYVLSFGIIGLVFWLIMIICPIYKALRKIKFKIFNNVGSIFMLCSMLYAGAFAFFQPYFILPCIMTCVYLLIGCYYLMVIQENSLNDSN